MSKLIQAVLNNDIAALRQSIACGCDIDTEDGNGMTALLHACAEQNEAMLQWLIDAGADINHKNKNGFSALDIATIAGEVAMATYSMASQRMQKILVRHGAKSGFDKKK